MDDERPSVLHVIASADRRGAEVFATDLHDAMSGHGWHSDVVALVRGRGGLDVECLGTRPRGPGTLVALRRRVRRYDRVVAHGSATLAACALACAGTGTPFAYRVIGDPSYWASTPGRRWRVRALLRRAWRVVALWPEAAEWLAANHRVARRKIAVVPNAVRADRFEPAGEAQRSAARERLGVGAGPVVAFIGALSSEKRPDLAVDAVAGMADAVLVVAGDGPARAEAEQRAARCAPGRVRFLGALDDVRPVLDAADVLAIPSDTEGMPAVAIEAAFAGVPVVATDVGGLRHVVNDPAVGRLVPAGDPAALRRGLTEVLERPHTAGGRVGVRCALDIDRVARQWEEVLAGRSGGGL